MYARTGFHWICSLNVFERKKQHGNYRKINIILKKEKHLSSFFVIVILLLKHSIVQLKTRMSYRFVKTYSEVFLRLSVYCLWRCRDFMTKEIFLLFSRLQSQAFRYTQRSNLKGIYLFSGTATGCHHFVGWGNQENESPLLPLPTNDLFWNTRTDANETGTKIHMTIIVIFFFKNVLT